MRHPIIWRDSFPPQRLPPGVCRIGITRDDEDQECIALACQTDELCSAILIRTEDFVKLALEVGAGVLASEIRLRGLRRAAAQAGYELRKPHWLFG